MRLFRFLASTWTGRAIAGIVVVAVVFFGIVAPRLGAAAPEQPLRTATAARANIAQTVAVSGSVNADQIQVSFRPTGLISEILVKVGDVVTKGQPLARLDPRDLQNAVTQAQANLQKSQATYDDTVAGVPAEDVALARNALQSATNTYGASLQGAQSDVDAAQRALDQAARALQDAQSNAASGVTTKQQAFEKAKSDYATAKTTLSGIVATLRADLNATSTSIAGARTQVTAALDATANVQQTSDVTAARASLAAADVSLGVAQHDVDTLLTPALNDYAAALGGVLSATSAFDSAFTAGSDTTTLIGSFRTASDAYSVKDKLLTTAISTVSTDASTALTSARSALTSLSTVDSSGRWVLDPARTAVTTLQGDLLAAQSAGSTMSTHLGQADTAVTTVAADVTGDLVSARDAYTTAQTSGTTSVRNATDSLTSAQVALTDAKDKGSQTSDAQRIALENAKLQFQKSTAAPKESDIAIAAANVQLAQLALDSAKGDLDDATLKAPADGAVASIANDVGEKPSSPFIVLAATTRLTLHGTVGEADVAQLRTGLVATVVVDAIRAGSRLTGRVTALDPVATIQQGVPVYGVDVTIDRPDPQIRSGMSGTATVIVAAKQGVIVVPNSAVRTVGGQKTIQVLRSGQAVAVDATFGISNDTMTEVTSGVNEGDVVVLPALRTTTTTGQQQGGPFGGAGGGARGPVIVGPGR